MLELADAAKFVSSPATRRTVPNALHVGDVARSPIQRSLPTRQISTQHPGQTAEQLKHDQPKNSIFDQLIQAPEYEERFG